MFIIVNYRLISFVLLNNQTVTIPFLHQLFSAFKANELYGRYISLRQIESSIKFLDGHFLIDVIGHSVKKKPIYQVTIGNGPKRVLVWSQMHGNESTTTKALFDVFNVFMHCEDKQIKEILQSCTLVILPMLNPDGAEQYTRNNANDIDLNRDAMSLSQPESKCLRGVFNSFKPDFCYNLHGQRSIFSAGKNNQPAILSFLAPAQDSDFSITPNRKVAMDLICRIHNALQIVIPDQMGIYDDTFNINCVGDTFQSLGVPTILFEAGHFPDDYQREITRELIFKVLLLGLDIISNAPDLGMHHKFYFQIPQNEKLFRDVIIRNVIFENETKDIAVQYDEALRNGLIEFRPRIDAIETSLKLYGHREIDANFTKIVASSELRVSNEIDFVTINNEKFALFA